MQTKGNKSDTQSVTPAQAAGQIRFALSELSPENAHHEFEHLCRFLTRARICSNVVPSTGPVSGGGDQGVDFETYAISPSLEGSSFFALATDEKWIFACSLEKNVKKKIKSDLSSAALLDPKPDKVYFFHHLPIQTSVKHSLQKFANTTHGIALEIMDCKAISELLTDADTVWIAERYLSLPSAFILARKSEPKRWYEELLDESNDLPLTDGGFFKLRDAIREVAYTPELRADALRLFTKIRRYRDSTSPRIRRKAIYEEFVASLRGLGDSVGYEEDVRSYFFSIETLNDPADLEDASVIVGYVLGARILEGFCIELSEIEVWHSQLSQLVTRLLADTQHASRKCALMISQASLQFSLGKLLASSDYENQKAHFRDAAANAISTWREIIVLSEQSPLFPVERIANFADSIADLLDGVPGNDKLQKDLDKILSIRSGQRELIQRRLHRAGSYQEAGKLLRALGELHQAQVDAISAEDAVLLTLFLARLYSQLGLYFASKYYALSSAYAAFRVPEEDLRALTYAGTAEAAACDYVTGGSLMFFLTAESFLLSAHNFSMKGTQEKRQFEWARIDFHLIQTTYWSKLISNELQIELLHRLETWDCKDIYEETIPSILQSYGENKTLADITTQTTAEGMNPLFSDAGPNRLVTWTQLQIQWSIGWTNSYEVARFSESFCAYLQIILAELTDLELSILPGKATVNIQSSKDEKFEFEDIPDNHSVSRKLHIPLDFKDSEEEAKQAVLAVIMFLDSFSAERQENLMEPLGRRIGERMPKIRSAYAPNPQLFEEFYLKEDYEALYRIVENYDVRQPLPEIEGNVELSGPTGIHPNYEPVEFHKQIERRYRRIPPVIKFTLERLKNNPQFIADINTLRTEGWKDWHILLAIVNVRLNYLYGYRGDEPPGEEFRKAFTKRFEEPELKYDPSVPLTEFSAENLRKALQIARLTTLHSWGFQVRQRTPYLNGIDAFLKRFNYWTDDVEHEALF